MGKYSYMSGPASILEAVYYSTLFDKTKFPIEQNRLKQEQKYEIWLKNLSGNDIIYLTYCLHAEY